MNKTFKSLLLFFLAGLCFTIANTLSKQTTVSVWALTSLRFLLSSAIVFFLIGKDRINIFSKPNLKFHLLSLLFLLRCAAILTGFQLTALAKPIAVVLTWPILFAGLSVVFLGTKLSKVSIASLSLAASGMFFILGDPSLLAPGENMLGYGFMLAGAILTAIEMLLNRRAIEKQGGLKVLFYSNFLAGLLSMPTLTSFANQTLPQSTVVGVIIVSFLVLGTCVYYIALENSSPISTAVFSYLEVPTAALAAVFVYDEQFSVRSIVGISFILCGALLVSMEQARRGTP